ncbi:MAG: hypothetical protein JNL94_10850 [Planctomycetes bacterium]|nr:hypothetical protein [Planctomycetota bacterium]
MRLRPFLAATCVVASSACTAIETERPLPDEGYDFYTGSEEEQGDAYLRQVEFTHPETKTTVVLVPMIHIAEAQYYRAVQAEMDAADVVLLEGIGGSSSLGPMKLLTTYLFANYPRWAALGGFAQQGEVIVAGKNARSGDMTIEEFKDQMPWYTPAVQLALFPFTVVGLETMNAFSYVFETLSYPLFAHDGYEAGFRHVFMSSLTEHDKKKKEEEEEEKEAEESAEATKPTSTPESKQENEGEEAKEDKGPEILLPGVLEARNAELLKRVDEVAAERNGQRIVLPWGGAHMPGVEKGLLEKGYERSAAKWRLAVKVKKLHDDVTPEDEDTPFDFYVPFAIQVRKLDAAWSLSMLFHSITWEHAPDHDDAFSLLWDMAFSWSQNARKDAVSWQLLPSLFDRPLLFAYEGEGETTRLRFLLLGDVEF